MAKKRFTRSAFRPVLQSPKGEDCSCGACKGDGSEISSLRARDVPEERVFLDAILKVFADWREQEWDTAGFRASFIDALEPLCLARCREVLEGILADAYIQSLDINDWWREVMQEPRQRLVGDFLAEYTQKIVTSTMTRQRQSPDAWQNWAFGETRADTLATDINALLESGTHLTFQVVYTAAVKEANRG